MHGGDLAARGGGLGNCLRVAWRFMVGAKLKVGPGGGLLDTLESHPF